MIRSRQIRVLFLFAFFLLPGLIYAATDKPAKKVLKEVMTVNGRPVYSDELEQAISSFVPTSSFHGGISEETRARYRSKALDLLVDRELIYQDALRLGLKPDAKRVDETVEKATKDFGSKKAFQDALASEGLTLEDYRRRIEKEFLVDVYAKQQLTDRSTYTDDELKAYYAKNIESFRRPPSMEVWHIILKVPANARVGERDEKRKLAADITAKARKGESFEYLAEKYAEDEYRVVGGKLGLVHKGQLMPELETVAFSMKAGEISDPVETIYGFHVIKAGARKESGVVPFEDMRDKLRKDLEAEKFKKLKSDTLARLKKDSVVKIHE